MCFTILNFLNLQAFFSSIIVRCSGTETTLVFFVQLKLAKYRNKRTSWNPFCGNLLRPVSALKLRQNSFKRNPRRYLSRNTEYSNVQRCLLSSVALRLFFFRFDNFSKFVWTISVQVANWRIAWLFLWIQLGPKSWIQKRKIPVRMPVTSQQQIIIILLEDFVIKFTNYCRSNIKIYECQLAVSSNIFQEEYRA